MNRLTLARVQSMKQAFEHLLRAASPNADHKPVVVTGNDECFSVGADLNEIAALPSAHSLEFAKFGQGLMSQVDHFPAPVYAAISGYCMGGGLDLAIACDFRVCAANAIFGHRGAALGLITGWGGTQRLAKLVGRGKALQMFTAAEKLNAADALDAGLVTEIAANPLMRCVELIATRCPEVA